MPATGDSEAYDLVITTGRTAGSGYIIESRASRGPNLNIPRLFSGSPIGSFLENVAIMLFGAFTLLNAGLLFAFDFVLGFCIMADQTNAYNGALLASCLIQLCVTFACAVTFAFLGINCLRSGLVESIRAVSGVRSPSSIMVLGTVMAVAFMIMGLGFGFVHHP